MFKTLGTKAWELLNTNAGSIAVSVIVTHQLTKSHRAEEIAVLKEDVTSLKKDLEKTRQDYQALKTSTNILKDRYISQTTDLATSQNRSLRHELRALEYQRAHENTRYCFFRINPTLIENPGPTPQAQPSNIK